MVAVPVPDVSTDTLPLSVAVPVIPVKTFRTVAAFVPFSVTSPSRDTPPAAAAAFKPLNVTVTFFSLPPSVTLPCPHGVSTCPAATEAVPTL